jgi:hypothetical protein
VKRHSIVQVNVLEKGDSSMRSIRTMLLVAIAAFAFAAPALASASEWTHEGSPLVEKTQWYSEGSPLTSEAPIAVTGKVKFTSVATGGIECSMSETLTPVPGGSTAKVSGVSISAAGCVTNGVIANEKCTVSSVTPNSMNGNTTANSSGVMSRYFNVTYKLAGPGGKCKTWETFTVLGEAVQETPNNTEAISSWTLSGTAKFSYGSLPVNMSGTLNASPAGKYGVLNVQPIKLSGMIKLNNGAFGAVGCPLSGSLVPAAGGKGQITSLSGSGCTGSIAYFCNNKEMTLTATAPWQVVNEGTLIRVPAAVFAVHSPKSSGCAEKNEFLYGELKLTPNSSTAIASTVTSGTLTSQPEGLGYPWSTSEALNWSPSGYYGLK